MLWVFSSVLGSRRALITPEVATWVSDSQEIAVAMAMVLWTVAGILMIAGLLSDHP